MTSNDFVSLASSLNNIHLVGGEMERTRITNVLKSLNKCDYRHIYPLNSTRIVLLINQLCAIIPPDDVDLVTENVKLLAKLLHLVQALPQGSYTLPQTQQWLESALKTLAACSFSEEHLIPTLNALAAFFECHSEMAFASISDQLTSLLATSTHRSVHIALLQCIEPLARSDHLENVAGASLKLVHLLLRHLEADGDTSYDNVDACHVAALRLRILNYLLLSLDGATASPMVALLIGVCRSLMLVNVRHVPPLRIAKVLPSAFGDAFSGDAQPPPKMTQSQHRRKHRRPVVRREIVDVLPPSSGETSDTATSDASDSEMALLLYRHETHVRHAALMLLLTTCRCMDRATLGAYIGALFADAAPSSAAHAHYVSTCVLRDPSARCRAAALAVLQHVLVTIQPCLQRIAAEDDVDHIAFTPLSAVVAGMLRELHRALCLSLAEPSSSNVVLTQSLKCVAALVQATPYHRLRPGLTTKIVRNLKPLIVHKDTTIQVAALIVLGCLLNSTPPLEELRKALAGKTSISETKPQNSIEGDEEEEEEEMISDGDMPLIMKTCISFASSDIDRQMAPPPPVRLESLQVLAAMCTHHFAALVHPHLTHVAHAIHAATLEERNVDVRFHAARAAERLSTAMCGHFEMRACLQMAATFWRAMLGGGGLMAMAQCETSATLRAVACDCMASIGEHVFDVLPPGERIVLVTSLLSMCKDGDASVRACAVRALGIFLLFNGGDEGFIADAAHAIMEAMRDANIGVRVKASWSLGNLSEIMTREVEGVENAQLIKVAVAATRDAEKVKANAVRALGNLLRSGRGLQDGVDALLECATSASTTKVRWNACYALAHVLRMDVVFSGEHRHVGRRVLTTLARLVADVGNFKVRISAAMAVTGCARTQYGDVYIVLWVALVGGLESAENVGDFNEFQHRDQLVEQICLAIGHLTSVIEVGDLMTLLDLLNAHKLSMMTHVQKVYVRLAPEKTTILLAAKESLAVLRQNNQDLAAGERKALQILEEIFDLHFVCWLPILRPST